MLSENDDCPYGVYDCPKVLSLRNKLDDMSLKQDVIATEVNDIKRIIKDCGYVIALSITVVCAFIGACFI